MKEISQGEMLLYQDENGSTQIEVRLENENVWLTQAQLVTLYQSSKANVSEHIKHIFEEGELQEMATVRKFRTVQKEGSREVTREVVHYNLDLIISLGYRIKSHIATKFRIWATQRLKEYIIKGFVIDDNRLKQNAGGNYWYELLNRIRDIRSSEKVLYRQVDMPTRDPKIKAFQKAVVEAYLPLAEKQEKKPTNHKKLANWLM